MTTYVANPANFLGERVINAVTAQGEIPILSITGHADILAGKLIENLADALNGAKPRHSLPYNGLRATFSRTDNNTPLNGIKIVLRKDEHLSRDGLMISVLGEGDLAAQTLAALHEGTAAARLIRAMQRDARPSARPGSDLTNG
jgi:hypothetical protein